MFWENMQIVNKVNNLPASILSMMSCDKAGFFCSLDWFDNFIKTVAQVDGFDIRYFYMHDNFNILIPTVAFRDGLFRKVRSLGNYYSPIFTIFLGEKWPDFIEGEQFFMGLKKIRNWDVMELRPLSSDECSYIKKCADRAGLIAIKYHCFVNWYLDVNNRTYDEYYLGLPSRLRNIIKRKSKQFFEIDGARIDIIYTKQEFDEGLMAYDKVYRASWKASEPYPDFMNGLMSLGLSRGIGRLGVAYIGAEAVAAQYWIVSNNMAYIFKLAYDEGYKKHSVGTVLTSKMMEFVIDKDKVDVVDFLTGDDVYKKDWMNNKRDRFGIVLFNPTTLFGVMGGIVEMLKQLSKSFLRII